MTHPSEFDRQVQTLVANGYPARAGLTEAGFAAMLERLRPRLKPSRNAAGKGRIPFVVVVQSDLVAATTALTQLALNGKPAVSVIEPDDLARFAPIDGVTLPAGPAYLLLDVDTGASTLNVTPDDALRSLRRRRRSPLTVAEGLAVITQFPDILRTRNAFSLLASRCGDRRVPALWLSKGHPKLGWCWAGNPHTWLGSASCGARVAA